MTKGASLSPTVRPHVKASVRLSLGLEKQGLQQGITELPVPNAAALLDKLRNTRREQWTRLPLTSCALSQNTYSILEMKARQGTCH